MKLKKPITDTTELIELALLVMHSAAAASVPKEVCPEVGKALALMVQAAEKLHGEEGERIATAPVEPRNDGENGSPSSGGDAATFSPGVGEGKGEKKREVWPEQYAKTDKLFLHERLFEYAEWAACNEWETPLCLADDLIAAAKFIRFMGEQYPHACEHYERTQKGADE